MRKMNKPLAAALIAATVLSMTACAQTGTASVPGANLTTISNTDTNTIQVNSTEGVKVVPDMAQVNFAVLSQAGDPKACQENNSKDTSSVIEFLKNSGIDEKSIQTSSYGLEPMYDWNNTGQQITGYQMRTSITVSDLPIDQVGTMLSSSVEAGINCIDSVNYLSSKYDENYREALKKAVEAGLGISCISKRCIKNEINSNTLSWTKLKEFEIKRKLILIYHKDKFLSTLLKTFIKFALENV